jgi:hypothetical protein
MGHDIYLGTLLQVIRCDCGIYRGAESHLSLKKEKHVEGEKDLANYTLII